MLFRDIVYYRCRDCGKVFVKHERFKSVLRYYTDETPMCPECFSRRTNPPGIGWLFRIKELLTTSDGIVIKNNKYIEKISLQ